MQQLVCTGSELSIGECSWSAPDQACFEHRLDAVVFCGDASHSATPEGAVRLLSNDGAPSLSGTGVLEVHVGGVWSPVCGITPGAAAVACKLMGFAGAATPGGMSLAGHDGHDSKEPRVGDLDCGGSEPSILDCSFQAGDDVFCAAAEATVVHCTGEGDTTGQMNRVAHIEQ